jgi:hypothetical protein
MGRPGISAIARTPHQAEMRREFKAIAWQRQDQHQWAAPRADRAIGRDGGAAGETIARRIAMVATQCIQRGRAR